GDPRNPDPVPERTQMLLTGELAHQRAALTRRQPGISQGADQRIPEQGNLSCPISTAALIGAASSFVAHRPPSTSTGIHQGRSLSGRATPAQSQLVLLTRPPAAPAANRHQPTRRTTP